MKTFTEFDLARAIFIQENMVEICRKAENNNIDSVKFNRTLDIMWDLETDKRKKCLKEAHDIYPFVDHNKYPKSDLEAEMKVADELGLKSLEERASKPIVDKNIPTGQPMGIDTTMVGGNHLPNYGGLNEILQHQQFRRYGSLTDSPSGLVRLLSEVREYALGFTCQKVYAGATIIISVQPQVFFKGRRLVIPETWSTSTCAEHFIIHWISIGNEKKYFECPASKYNENHDEILDLTCNVGQLIAMSVTNKDKNSDHIFSATLFGVTIV